jgi:hypothetical protein
MSDIGMKVSQAGYPADTCSDEQLLFSSSFPAMPVLFTGTLGIGNSFTHNLGYYPAYCIQYNTTDTASNPVAYFTGSDVTTTTLDNEIYNASIGYTIFARNLLTNYTAPIINTTAAIQTINHDYGYKVSKDGQEVTTATLQNLTSFSGASLAGYGVRQWIVHQSGYGTINNGDTVNIGHSLGYTPMFLFYWGVVGSNKYTLGTAIYNLIGGANVIFQATINSSQLSIINNEGNNFNYAYIIFKDPAS